MQEELGFTITRVGESTKIKNFTDYKLIISLKPKKPKRKVTDIFIVHEHSFLIMEFHFGFRDIYVSFEG